MKEADKGPSAAEIRNAQDAHPKIRARDLAASLDISEAAVVAARCGTGAVRIAPHPDGIVEAAMALGQAMALTRTEDCVHEKVGLYEQYHPGSHAAMVLGADIDLRMFPSHWRHAFAVETCLGRGVQRSLQVFDAAGDAVHKVFLRDGSDVSAWQTARDRLRAPDQSDTIEVEPRAAVEGAKINADKVDILRREWTRLTDTHQFLRLTSKLRMNRLGAYRVAGPPFVRPLAAGAATQMLRDIRDSGVEVMVFVGNRGCIQIHSGPIRRVEPMGPWQNVLDPGFNLHLRADRIAELWAVKKPTQRGPAVSVEAFNAEGGLIFQVFGVGKEGRDNRPAWNTLVDALPGAEEVTA